MGYDFACFLFELTRSPVLAIHLRGWLRQAFLAWHVATIPSWQSAPAAHFDKNDHE